MSLVEISPVPQLGEGLPLQLPSLGLVKDSLAVSIFIVNVPLAVLYLSMCIHTS